MFGTGWQRSAVRRRVVSLVGELPGPRELGAEAEALPAARQREAFRAFLELVAEARAGQGVVAMPRAWLPQAVLLERYAELAGPIETTDLADLAAFSGVLSDRLAVPGLPDSHVRAVLDGACTIRLAPGAYVDPSAVDLLDGLFGKDFEALGHKRWPPGWHRS